MSVDIRSLAGTGGAPDPLLSFVPESIRDDPEVIAVCHAIAPQLSAVAVAVERAIVLPRLATMDPDDPLTAEIVDAVAWGFKLQELRLWEWAPLANKQALLAGILLFEKRAGTVWAVKQFGPLMGWSFTLREHRDDPGSVPKGCYAIHITGSVLTTYPDADAAVREWCHRFADTSAKLVSLGFS